MIYEGENFGKIHILGRDFILTFCEDFFEKTKNVKQDWFS